MFNLHSLFAGSPSFAGFRQAIALTPDDRKKLRDARDLIRAELRIKLPALIKEKYPELPKIPTPKFHTQGSWAYGTIIRPTWEPPQQADMDDGCYMPLSFLKGATPSIASEFFFTAVETALAPLCKKHGWKINPTGKKDTCTRIEIDGNKHIDLPLYAIPDTEFEALVEAESKFAFREGHAALRAADLWALLPTDSLLLAHRKQGWKPSDPRPLKDWLNSQVMVKTNQLRNIMQYIKAWRDWQWKNGSSPTSILLMAAIDEAFDEPESRDDLALLKVAGKLPEILSGNVKNPVAEHECLSNKLDSDGIRNEVVMQARRLYSDVNRAIRTCDNPTEACAVLQGTFGPRFPANAAAVEKIKPATIVLATPMRKIQSQQPVGRSIAG